MAAVAGQATTFNLPNFVGELFRVTPRETPFVAMMGNLAGGSAVQDKRFTWQTTDNNAAAQPSSLEGADPTYEERDRAEVYNVTQIYQYGVEISYTRLITTGMLGPFAADRDWATLGIQPVQDEWALQRDLKLDRAARDLEYTSLQGAFVDPATNASARQSRGILTAITTNSVDATSTALSKTHVNNLVKDMVDNGAPMMNPVIFCNAFQKQGISSIYGYAPASRNVGGLNIETIESDFAILPVVYDRHMPAAQLLVADLSVCRLRFGEVPDKGVLFFEPLAKTGAAIKGQVYGEIGLEYGPEQWHGKIINLTTS